MQRWVIPSIPPQSLENTAKSPPIFDVNGRRFFNGILLELRPFYEMAEHFSASMDSTYVGLDLCAQP